MAQNSGFGLRVENGLGFELRVSGLVIECRA